MDNRARKNDPLTGKYLILAAREIDGLCARDPRLFYYTSLLLRQAARGSISQESSRAQTFIRANGLAFSHRARRSCCRVDV